MRLANAPSRRGGFTLIELLVVVGILALLVALTAAGIGKLKSGQQNANTRSTVEKAQVGIKQQLIAIRDDAKKPGSQHRQLLVPFCDNDTERAESLLYYAYVKRSFPQTFTEAKTPLTITGIPPIPGEPPFANLPLSSASGLSADQEAAVILYRIVMNNAKRGMNQSEEAFSGATATITSTTGVDYQVLKDAYGTHIAFARWYGANPASPHFAELQAAPYVNPKMPSFDPYDPLGKLRQNPWPISGVVNRNGALAVLNFPAGVPAVAFDGANKVITVISAGADKKFGPVFGGSAADGDDDVFGFRLAQYGN